MQPKITWNGSTGTCTTTELRRDRKTGKRHEKQCNYNLKAVPDGWHIHNQTEGEIPTLYEVYVIPGGHLACNCALSRKSGIHECIHKQIVKGLS